MKKLIRWSIVIVVLLAMVSPVSAVEVKLSGFINPMGVYIDNGVDSDTFFVTNNNATTRFRLKGVEQYDAHNKVGFEWENQFNVNPSGSVDVDKDSETEKLQSRIMEVFIENSKLGKLSLGKGPGAAEYTCERDISGTGVILYSELVNLSGNVYFVDSDGNKIIKMRQVHDHFDGLGRMSRARYDTPKFKGAWLSSSFDNASAWEVAARWYSQGRLGKIQTAIGYVDSGDMSSLTGTDYTQFGGSVSYIHPSGLSLTVAYGERDQTDYTDSENLYVKLGYKFGKHAFGVEYGQTNDLNLDGDEFRNYGVGYVYNLIKGVELYAGYRIQTLDRDTGSDLEDISLAGVGARVKFW